MADELIRGSCLCGDIAWSVDAPFEMMHHCHCSRCRKALGTAFATFAMVPSASFRLGRGQDRMVRWESSPGTYRPFCGRCGTVVPDGQEWEGRTFLPAGSLDDDPGVRPMAHIFVASKAPWYEITDDLPRFDDYPTGVEARIIPDREMSPPTPGAIRGSCLCGEVTFVVDGPLRRAYNCHCSRCRKAKSAAHASNLFTTDEGLRFLSGEDRLVSYKLPQARFFTHVFCRTCGSDMPRADRERQLGIIPMGALDDDSPLRPQRNIFVDSKAPWFEISDSLPRDPGAAPPL